MFHFGRTELCIISGCTSLTQQLFIAHYLCLANLKASFFQRDALSRAGFSLFQTQLYNVQIICNANFKPCRMSLLDFGVKIYSAKWSGIFLCKNEFYFGSTKRKKKQNHCISTLRWKQCLNFLINQIHSKRKCVLWRFQSTGKS